MAPSLLPFFAKARPVANSDTGMPENVPSIEAKHSQLPIHALLFSIRVRGFLQTSSRSNDPASSDVTSILGIILTILYYA
jgi:hypothetical protein